MVRTLSLHVFSLFIFVSLASVARAENWPGYRGPTGQGTTPDTNLPVEWGGPKDQNVRWKSPLPGTVAKGDADHNQASPIIWNGRVYVATAYWPAGKPHNEYPEQHVTCYGLADGKQIWDVQVPHGPWQLGDLRGGYGASTPATDGQRLYVVFGSAIIAALDMNGKLLWKQTFPDYNSFDVCYATSPLLYKDTVILNCARNGNAATIVAYDAATGETRWNKKRPNVAFDHNTPTLATIAGKPQLLVPASNALQGVNPDNGDVLWFVSTPGDVPSPVTNGTIVYSDSGRGGPGVAVDPNGSGDITKNIKWKVGNIPEALGSAAISGDYLLRLHTPAVLRTFDIHSGKELFSSRLEGVTTQASPIVAPNGIVYLASAGKSYVVKAGPKLDILATNDLQDSSESSPAVADGKMILKGTKYLWCVEKNAK